MSEPNIVPITEGVRLSLIDPRNYVIEKKRVVRDGPNKGAVQWDAVAYHGTLKEAAWSLLHRHLDLVVDVTQAKDLRMLLSAIDEAAEYIAQACQGRPT